MAYQRYISLSDLALRWSISEAALRQNKAGSGELTRIRLGRSIRFLLEEVELVERRIEKVGRKLKAYRLELESV
jgi:hypothetical protein